MALNINGTTGISGVDGSASAPALTGTDSNTGINFASDTVNINTGGSTRATVDSAGRFLIGTTTDNGFKFKVSDGGGYEFAFAPNDSGVNSLVNYNRSGSAYVPFMVSGSDLRFGSGGNTERMRIDANGRMMINTTSTSSMLRIRNTGLVTHTLIELFDDGGTGTHSQIQFSNTNGVIGQIVTSGSSTTYATSSDYRLKENAIAISDGITRLKTLKPYRFNFIADASTTLDGFFAHEVTAVPEAITGTKDEVDSDNKPVYQGIDQSKLVPLLTAALQEAVAKIEVLETENTQMKTDLTALTARVTALEAA